MNDGWISLHRQIQDNVLWSDKPFAYGQAWIDILLMCNRKQNPILFNHKTIIVEAGQFLTSLRKLGDRWGWSRHKVDNFLNLLKNQNMIKLLEIKGGTMIEVVNYCYYQGFSDTKNTFRGQSGDTKGTFRDTNNNNNIPIYLSTRAQRQQTQNIKLSYGGIDNDTNFFMAKQSEE